MSAAPSVTDNRKLYVTGYSQGGYVAMATHRALQAAGQTVSASAPMSGPYALAAFGDALFLGEVNGSATVPTVTTGVPAASPANDLRNGRRARRHRGRSHRRGAVKSFFDGH